MIPGLAKRSKLLIPDMRSHVQPYLDEQGLYPHHNFYWLISDVWDLRVLGGLLLSDVAEAFVVGVLRSDARRDVAAASAVPAHHPPATRGHDLHGNRSRTQVGVRSSGQGQSFGGSASGLRARVRAGVGQLAGGICGCHTR